MATRSLDQLDREGFRAGPSPLEAPGVAVALRPGPATHPAPPLSLALDGEWLMAADEHFADAIPATVPGSVHTALVQAGRIPDPKVGLNDTIARAQSHKSWWFRRSFARPAGTTGERLVFEGVCNRFEVYLNGKWLGAHEGMFSAAVFAVEGQLQDENTLVVRLLPAPHEEGTNIPNPFFRGMNVGWVRTVVFNNVYGWHYSDIPALGIWRGVRLESAPALRLQSPFVATRDAAAGALELLVPFSAECRGRLVGTIAPENFAGPAWHFEVPAAGRQARLSLTLPDPRLWWPNGLGEPHLYRLQLSLLPEGGPPDSCATTFGVRTVGMRPLPNGPRPDQYDWTFVINGRPLFVKGTGWCTMDSSLDFSRARYDRFLSAAQQQHCQMVRAWGSGMPETDDFYDLCDRKGLLVMQEWPTAWNSHNWQPYQLLRECVEYNTLRLRNHPSLVMWGGGNESGEPTGPAIDMMGRCAIELDGTRPFHRGEPLGGSTHNYDCWWGKQPLDRNLALQAAFFGEFGIASLPVLESVQRYLPPEERDEWPPREEGSFAHHTPVFNKMEDLARLRQYAGYFTAGKTMADFVRGSQVAQATAVRHTLERARTRWPHCTGALMYKLNDNYPAVSWSTVDWYGAVKIAHAFVQDAFAPVHACVLLPALNLAGEARSLPVFLLDDADQLVGAWQVRVRAFGGQLQELHSQTFSGAGAVGRVRALGEFILSAAQAGEAPLLLVAEVVGHQRTFYWANYEGRPDSLFQLPRTCLRLELRGNQAVVTNTGAVPAVGVHLERPGHLDSFTASDNYCWLDPGEEGVIAVSEAEGVVVQAWNADER